MAIERTEAISRYSDNTLALLLKNTDENTTKQGLTDIANKLNSNKYHPDYHVNAIGSHFAPDTIMNGQLIINRLALLASQNQDQTRYFRINDL